MKKTILTLLVVVGSLISNAQDTLQKSKMFGPPTTNLFGLEMGLTSIDDTRQEVSFANSNITVPQRVTDNFYIVHYLGLGYSFSSTDLANTDDDSYVISYGIGIPLPASGRKSARMYIYLIDAYHYRPNKPIDEQVLDQRRIRGSLRTNKFEFSTDLGLSSKYSFIFGVAYRFGK
jgi:hypothetical protein